MVLRYQSHGLSATFCCQNTTSILFSPPPHYPHTVALHPRPRPLYRYQRIIVAKIVYAMSLSSPQVRHLFLRSLLNLVVDSPREAYAHQGQSHWRWHGRQLWQSPSQWPIGALPSESSMSTKCSRGWIQRKRVDEFILHLWRITVTARPQQCHKPSLDCISRTSRQPDITGQATACEPCFILAC
jgi:hypothetical protein